MRLMLMLMLIWGCMPLYRRRRSRFDVMLISPMFVNTPSGGWQVGVEKVLQAMVWKAKRSTSLHVHVGRRSWGT